MNKVPLKKKNSLKLKDKNSVFKKIADAYKAYSIEVACGVLMMSCINPFVMYKMLRK